MRLPGACWSGVSTHGQLNLHTIHKLWHYLLPSASGVARCSSLAGRAPHQCRYCSSKGRRSPPGAMPGPLVDGCPPLPLWYRPGCPLGLAPTSGSSGFRNRGSWPRICPEASPGEKPPEGLGFQAFLLKGSPGESHAGILSF